jgi:TetR/AcrR family transcriptional regulator
MGKKSIITQNKITETATELFLEKGFDGVKMQELADRAGVNKGLLHHYFNNKKSLFETVFTQAIDQMFGKIHASLNQSGNIESKINTIVDVYFDMLIANPKLPIFVFFELNKNPERIKELFNVERISILMDGLMKDNKGLTKKKVIHVILTIVSLSVFPFMAKPIVMEMAKSEKNFAMLIEERRPMVKMIISNLLKSL